MSAIAVERVSVSGGVRSVSENALLLVVSIVMTNSRASARERVRVRGVGPAGQRFAHERAANLVALGLHRLRVQGVAIERRGVVERAAQRADGRERPAPRPIRAAGRTGGLGITGGSRRLRR
ncbi:hypothetical protein [Burkholderia sp. IMCC1007]|uniref:hypothetical protein n=1 Tax=Burkholderia sp. IMCC1007 TaxID=3004104 RepID=UPI003FA4AEF9